MTDPTSLTTLAEVRSLVSTKLADADLQGVIDREEAALARQIGPLSGERTQTFYIGSSAPLYLDPVLDPRNAWIQSDRMGRLVLQRPTVAGDDLVVTDNGTDLDPTDVRLLRGGTAIERASGGWTGPVVEVTSVPSDELEVKRVVIELCRLTLVETGLASEQIGDYQYTRSAESPADARRSLIRSLMTHPPAGTLRVRTSSEDDRIGGSV